MPDIRPISDLRSRFTEISRLAHESGEPIFLTKNGYGDLVVLSVEAYETLVQQAKFQNTPPPRKKTAANNQNRDILSPSKKPGKAEDVFINYIIRWTNWQAVTAGSAVSGDVVSQSKDWMWGSPTCGSDEAEEMPPYGAHPWKVCNIPISRTP